MYFIMLSFKSSEGTYIKKSTEQSSKLPQGQKRYYPKFTEIQIESVLEEKDGHLYVQMAYGQGKWYLFTGHWELQNTNIPINFKEVINFLYKHEDLRLEAYPDGLHGWNVPTIGIGTTIYPNGQSVKKGDRITKEEAETYAMNFIKTVLTPVLSKIPTWVRMNANQQTALYSFGYNLGASFYGGDKFTSITAVCDSPHKWNNKQWIESQFVKYRNPGTNVEEGLRRRRQDEAKLFCTPVVTPLTLALPPIPIDKEETQLELNISGSVGINGKNEPGDVIAVRHRLRQLGYNTGLNENKLDSSLIQAIKLFQSITLGATRLTGDGRIDVNGRTHGWFNSPNAPRWVTMTRESKGLINVEALETWDYHDYGTDWIDEFFKKIASDYEDNYRKGRDNISLVQVNDVSYKHGGDTPDHGGHETGLCGDLRLPSTIGGGRTIVGNWRSQQYHRTACLEQLKLIKAHPLTKLVYFNDPEAIRLGLCKRAGGHDTHIHITIKPKKP